MSLQWHDCDRATDLAPRNRAETPATQDCHNRCLSFAFKPARQSTTAADGRQRSLTSGNLL